MLCASDGSLLTCLRFMYVVNPFVCSMPLVVYMVDLFTTVERELDIH